MVASVASMIDMFNHDNILLLEELGYQVDVACNFQSGNPCSQNRINRFKEELENHNRGQIQLDIPRSIYKIKDIVKSYRCLQKKIEHNQYDIVHAHSPIGGVVARLAAKRARKKGTKVIYTAHGFHFFKGAPLKNWLIFYPIEKLCGYITDCLITINKEDYSRAKSSIPAKKISYVPGIGVPVDKIQKTYIDVRKLKDEFGIKENTRVILSINELSKRKNSEVTLRAFAKSNVDNAVLLFCGTGKLEDRLKCLAKELQIEDSVIFAGFREDIYDILKISDLFIFPTFQEGLPVALMEAMATGLPVICSDIRGNRDLVENEKGGYLLQPTDVEGFANNIVKIINDRQLAAEFSKVNLESIKQFDTTKVNKIMYEVYTNL